MLNPIKMSKKEIINAVFIIPIINNKVYLAQRNTEPYKNYFGPVGGKIDKLHKNHKDQLFYSDPIGQIFGNIKLVQKEKELIQQGFENTKLAGFREFCEEIFTDKNYPQDFKENQFEPNLRLFEIIDENTVKNKIVKCTVYITKINSTDFSLSKREITQFKPLELINENQIFPMAKVMLYITKYLIEIYPNYIQKGTPIDNFKELNGKIPEFKELNHNFPTSFDLALKFREGKLKGLTNDQAILFSTQNFKQNKYFK
jgi:hypothetical protein